METPPPTNDQTANDSTVDEENPNEKEPINDENRDDRTVTLKDKEPANDNTESAEPVKTGCKQALINQASRFCSPHTAIPEEWAEGKKFPLLYGPYGLSSFTYSALGIWILIAVHDMRVLGTPPIIDGILLILQGIISYGCDVYTFGYTSVFKIFDRCGALVTMIWWTSKIFYVRMMWWQYILFIGTGVIAIACKFKGEVSMRNLQWTQFLVWHSLWHLAAPLGLFVWSFVRNQ